MNEITLSQMLVLVGACFILKYGTILNFIRDRLTKIKFFKELFSCSLCLGFWIGLLFGGLWNVLNLSSCWHDTEWISRHVLWLVPWISQSYSSFFLQCSTFLMSALEFALISSGLCWLADHLMKVIWFVLYGPEKK